ncbi:glycosyltransferase [Chloroflexota bacterium]
MGFLDSGPPPIYVGFGSVPVLNQERITQLVIESLSKLGKRGILQIGRNGKSGQVLDYVFQAGWVPHEWLIPKMAALVHHGGANTTANGLRSGLPSIIIPFAWDQPFWGYQVYNLGVGPKPILRKELTVSRLMNAMDKATSYSNMTIRASAIGKVIQNENGVERAVEVINF